MKRQISVLDQATIDKIAAGEVVERPSSVVKELVENSIDAGASAITVEIKEGGILFIRITDNGFGIEKEQVPLAFLRHATSKIREVEDLTRISSLGFRGEALSSIAAVSRVELITKPREQLIGLRYVIEGGQERETEEIGAPDGTTFLIRDLFYNTPARAKFLKTPVTEAGYVSALIEQLALSHPHISFKYMQNGQTKLHTSGNNNRKEVIYQIYGREITRELIALPEPETDEEIQIRGFIGKPSISRGNRNFENYYVNGRYVKSKVIMKAIEDAYHTFLMQHKYPFTSLEITLKGEDVDINVHPAKMEVRFSDQEQIYRRVYDCVRAALTHRELIPEVTVSPAAQKEKNPMADKKVQTPEPFEYKRRELEQSRRQLFETADYSGEKQARQTTAKEADGRTRQRKQAEQNPISKEYTVPNSGTILKEYTEPNSETVPKEHTEPNGGTVPKEHTEPNGGTIPKEHTEPNSGTVPKEHTEPNSGTAPKEYAIPEKKVTPEEQTPWESPNGKEKQPQQLELFDGILLSEKAKEHHKIIGQVFDTYWLVQMGEKLYIIDQHAAHEKVLYERIVREIKNRSVTSQLLSPPLIISLKLQEEERLLAYREVFSSMGFEIERFGGKEYSIRAVPQNLFGLTGEDFFLELLDHLEDPSSKKSPEILLDRMATMACKAAVKGNQTLSALEARALIDELLELENPYNCPHGRPTIISMTKYELEKKFKRIV